MIALMEKKKTTSYNQLKYREAVTVWRVVACHPSQSPINTNRSKDYMVS